MPLGGLFKRKLKRNVFFHIPKTGGSTFIGALKEQYQINDQTPTHVTKAIGDLEIFHVDFKDLDRKFEGRDILKKIDKFPKTNFFMILREPASRLLSEFNFQFHILNGKNKNPSAAILKKVGFKPQSFSEYIRLPEVQNYQSKFLLGRPLADPRLVEENEFQSLISAINQPNIYFGITEKYSSFLGLFQGYSKMKLPEKLILRKKTPKQVSLKISSKDLDYIKKCNQIDYALYKFGLEKLGSYSKQSNTSHKFIDPNNFTV
jgi:hypothetical protein